MLPPAGLALLPGFPAGVPPWQQLFRGDAI